MEGKGNSPHQGFIPLLPEMEHQSLKNAIKILKNKMTYFSRES